jgi:TolB protein
MNRRVTTAIVILALFFGCAAMSAADDLPPAKDTDDGRLVRLTHDGSLKQRPVWSPDGRQLAFTRHANDRIWLYLLDPATGEERRLTQRDEPEYDADWSPDGKRLAFAFDALSPNQGDIDVRLTDLEGSKIDPFAGTVGKLSHEEWPAWSPDGGRIAYTSTAPGNQEVMVAPVAGGEPTQLTNHLGTDAHPAWSPDGTQIAFATDRWGGLEIAVMRADGTDVRRLTESRGLDDYPVWSPDGGRIAFVSNRDGNYEVYVMAADGGGPTNQSRSPAVDSFPTWTRDGGCLTFVSDRAEGFDLYTLRLNAE